MSTGVHYKTLPAQPLFSVAKRTTSDMSTVNRLQTLQAVSHSLAEDFVAEFSLVS